MKQEHVLFFSARFYNTTYQFLIGLALSASGQVHAGMIVKPDNALILLNYPLMFGGPEHAYQVLK